MLIALLTILFLGGSSTGMLDYIADTRDNVKEVMVKHERRNEALSTIKAMKKITKARNKQMKRASKQFRKAFAGATVLTKYSTLSGPAISRQSFNTTMSCSTSGSNSRNNSLAKNGGLFFPNRSF